MKMLHSRPLVCATLLLCLAAGGVGADEWAQWRGPTRDGVWREQGLKQEFTQSQLPLRWTVEIASGYSGPTVADGRVYVTDRVAQPNQIERVHCFDWETGKSLWTYRYDCVYHISYPAGPRACVTIDDGRAYSLGAMGHLFCFDAKTGNVLWQHDLNTKYRIRMPIWGISASPLIDEGLLIVQAGGEDNACLVAFDKVTGEERWRALEDQASYCAPIIIEQAGQRVLICLTGDNIVALDPASGRLHWRHPAEPSRMVLWVATPVVSEDRLFVSGFYDGSIMLRLNPDRLAADLIWRRKGPSEKKTDSLHAIISTPMLEGQYIYGVDSYGELRCLEAETGNRVWENLEATPPSRWSTIHMVKNGDKTWMLNERGELIISRLSPAGYQEISRTKLIEPTTDQLRQRGGVCWSHPAYAYKHVFARNDKQLVCASLAAD